MRIIPRGFNLLLAGFALYAMLNVLDILSSVVALAYVPGSSEANHLMWDARTHTFLMGAALKTKVIYAIFQPAMLSLFVWLGSRSNFLASAPWFYYALEGLRVLASNVTIIVLYGKF